jgi:hypothetical protein
MKANELRIGNLVDLGNRIAKVIEIAHLSCVVVDLEETQDTIEDYERTKGIPLTEEWLVKFGVSKMDENTFFIGGYEIEYCEKNKVFNFYLCEIGDWYTSIQYVHQLQNLYFALIGEELELKERQDKV